MTDNDRYCELCGDAIQVVDNRQIDVMTHTVFNNDGTWEYKEVAHTLCAALDNILRPRYWS